MNDRQNSNDSNFISHQIIKKDDEFSIKFKIDINFSIGNKEKPIDILNKKRNREFYSIDNKNQLNILSHNQINENENTNIPNNSKEKLKKEGNTKMENIIVHNIGNFSIFGEQKDDSNLSKISNNKNDNYKDSDDNESKNSLNENKIENNNYGNDSSFEELKKDKASLIEEILNSNVLNDSQKNKLNKLIFEIKNTDISDIIKENNKLDIVFTLDNTLVSSTTINNELYTELSKKYLKKNLKFFSCIFNQKSFIVCLILRNGLSEFFEFAKKFCNFHINTLALEVHAKEIQKILENTFNIEFKSFQARDKKIGNKKLLESLNLNSKTSLIFDHNPMVWKKDYLNVIISKEFLDKEINNYSIDKNNNFKDSMQFFLDSYYFSFFRPTKNENEQIEWKNQKLLLRGIPFYYFNGKNNDENDIYSFEYLNSQKCQFTYMKNIIKIIYFFVFNYNISIPEVLKLIRYNIFYRTYFSLKYYKGVNDGKDNIRDIIENCGGKIFKENNNECLDENDKLFFICRKDDYLNLKEKINNDLKIYKNSKLVNDKYVVDCFYFMTNLEDELDNSEYYFKNEDEDLNKSDL